jgi:hypothetical protein
MAGSGDHFEVGLDGPVAPAPHRPAEIRERGCEIGDLCLARRALAGVLAIFNSGFTDEIHENSFVR